jgi:hypothetical protein
MGYGWALGVAMCLFPSLAVGQAFRPYKVTAKFDILDSGKRVGHVTWVAEWKKDVSGYAIVDGPLIIKGVTVGGRVYTEVDSTGRLVKSVSIFSADAFQPSTSSETYHKDFVIVRHIVRGNATSKRIRVTKGLQLVPSSRDWFWKRMPKVGEVSTKHVLNEGKWELHKSIYLGEATLTYQGKKVRAFVVKDQSGYRSWVDRDGLPYKVESKIAGVRLLHVRTSSKKTMK